MNTRFLVLGVVVAGLVAAGAALAGKLSTDSARAENLELREDGAVVSTLPTDEAVAKVSERVGFDVKVPSSIPDSLELYYVDSVLGPEGMPNALKLGIVQLGPKDRAKSGNVSVRIEETGMRTGAPTDRAAKFDLGVPGVDAYTQRTDTATGYWVFTADRGFTIAIGGADAINQGQLRDMMASLVR